MTPDATFVRFYRGHSMDGTLRPGDRLTIAPVDLAAVCAGDVIVFRRAMAQGSDEELAHRVIAVQPAGLATRGDNNPRSDASLVTAENLLGTVVQLERSGASRAVRNGRPGLLRARLLHARHALWTILRRAGRAPYGWLRASGVVARLWRPAIRRIHFTTAQGHLLKYVCRGKTVANWWPQRGYVEFRKPYDLVLWHEIPQGRLPSAPLVEEPPAGEPELAARPASNGTRTNADVDADKRR